MPRDKNEAKYLEFIGKGITESFENMEEFEKLKNETFYSDVKDIIYAVTIADSYLKGIYRINEIPIEPPYVTSMLVDFYYLGYCAKISFEHLRPFLVKKGEIKQEDIDPSFVATLFLKVLCKLISLLLWNFKQGYSHLSNNRGGWNKHGGEAKIAKSLNVEVGINVEVGKYL